MSNAWSVGNPRQNQRPQLSESEESWMRGESQYFRPLIPRKLLILGNARNAKSARFANRGYTAGTRQFAIRWSPVWETTSAQSERCMCSASRRRRRKAGRDCSRIFWCYDIPIFLVITIRLMITEPCDDLSSPHASCTGLFQSRIL